MKKERVDENGTAIGYGDIHANYVVENMEGLPVRVKVTESSNTESVYVKYYRTDGKSLPILDDNYAGCVTVRFSQHMCNGVKFGNYILGDLRNGNRNEVLYRLGFISKERVEVKAPFVFTRNIKKSAAAECEVCPLTMGDLTALPVGTDISKYNGMPLPGTENIIIASDKVGERVIGYQNIYGTEINL